MSFNPHPLFDSDWYLQQNPDVAQAGQHPLQHFLLHGWRERRDPHQLFITSYYLQNNPDVERAGVNPLIHYLEHGGIEGRDPHPFFDNDWYLQENEDVRSAGFNPLLHYCEHGWMEGRDPHPNFCTTYYLKSNPDVAAAQLNPLIHYATSGFREGRDTHPARYGYLSGIQADTFAQVKNASDSPEDKVELHSSTFHQGRRYKFKNAEELEILRAAHSQANNVQKEIAVFSSISGGYDNVYYHEHLLDNADYYLFCEQPHARRHVFKLRQLPYVDHDSARSARFVKTHAHMLLSGYQIAVWVDGNILIRGDISKLITDFKDSGRPVGAVPHPLRSSVYKEADECIRRQKDESELIREQIERYRVLGFDCSDLVESGFLMFRLDHPKLAPFLDAWWSEIECGSRRDQLSFNYAMEKTGATWFHLTQKPNSVRNHPMLALFQHGSNTPEYVDEPLRAVDPAVNYFDGLQDQLAKYVDRTADIVVCVHNALDVVHLCLHSVLANRVAERHRVIIVDDGSDNETKEWLSEFTANSPNVALIRHEKAIGYTKSANVGLRASKADLTILLNSDTIVAERWIEKLMDAAFSNPGVGIVGPLSSAASHQSIPDHRSSAKQTAVNDLPDGYSVSDMNEWCEKNSPKQFIPRVPLVHGFCFGITRDALEKIGYFDEERFPFGYGEENDYCFRAVNAGVSLAIATHTYVYHKKSQSFSNDDRRIALMQDGSRAIRQLHGATRVTRAIRTMQENPHLIRMRALAGKLYS